MNQESKENESVNTGVIQISSKDHELFALCVVEDMQITAEHEKVMGLVQQLVNSREDLGNAFTKRTTSQRVHKWRQRPLSLTFCMSRRGGNEARPTPTLDLGEHMMVKAIAAADHAASAWLDDSGASGTFRGCWCSGLSGTCSAMPATAPSATTPVGHPDLPQPCIMSGRIVRDAVP